VGLDNSSSWLIPHFSNSLVNTFEA
jgi:hypothetical protein